MIIQTWETQGVGAIKKKTKERNNLHACMHECMSSWCIHLPRAFLLRENELNKEDKQADLT